MNFQTHIIPIAPKRQVPQEHGEGLLWWIHQFLPSPFSSIHLCLERCLGLKFLDQWICYVKCVIDNLMIIYSGSIIWSRSYRASWSSLSTKAMNYIWSCIVLTYLGMLCASIPLLGAVQMMEIVSKAWLKDGWSHALAFNTYQWKST